MRWKAFCENIRNTYEVISDEKKRDMEERWEKGPQTMIDITPGVLVNKSGTKFEPCSDSFEYGTHLK